ncbi:MAG: RloB family protein [Clostridia bacterium]|nr:RloB family protein [Clostridia bacterium]
MNRKPELKQVKKILIICEGYEEEDYFNRLKQCGVWNAGYVVEVKNAESIDNIPRNLDRVDSIISIYRNKYGTEAYSAVVILCDTEVAPYSDFKRIRRIISDTYGENICDKILFFINPCIMQIILSHKFDVKLGTNSKHENRFKIKDFCGVSDYKADEHQRRAVMNQITAKNYIKMKNRARKLSSDYEVTPSTNVLSLFDTLDGTNSEWLEELIRVARL